MCILLYACVSAPAHLRECTIQSNWYLCRGIRDSAALGGSDAGVEGGDGNMRGRQEESAREKERGEGGGGGKGKRDRGLKKQERSQRSPERTVRMGTKDDTTYR
jgi:hypothetical protein